MTKPSFLTLVLVSFPANYTSPWSMIGLLIWVDLVFHCRAFSSWDVCAFLQVKVLQFFSSISPLQISLSPFPYLEKKKTPLCPTGLSFCHWIGLYSVNKHYTGHPRPNTVYLLFFSPPLPSVRGKSSKRHTIRPKPNFALKRSSV